MLPVSSGLLAITRSYRSSANLVIGGLQELQLGDPVRQLATERDENTSQTAGAAYLRVDARHQMSPTWTLATQCKLCLTRNVRLGLSGGSL